MVFAVVAVVVIVTVVAAITAVGLLPFVYSFCTLSASSKMLYTLSNTSVIRLLGIKYFLAIAMAFFKNGASAKRPSDISLRSTSLVVVDRPSANYILLCFYYSLSL